MGPCGGSNPGRAYREDESFHQPMVLLQLMEVLILGMVGRKSPGNSIPRGAAEKCAQSPSYFIEERTLTPEESPKHNAREDMAYGLSLPMWQTEEVPYEKADWLRPMQEAGTIPVEGDVDLESPLPLEPHLQQLLDGTEPSLAGTKEGGVLPLMSTSPPLLSMAKDLEPSPSHALD